jgi:tight adherence protein B
MVRPALAVACLALALAVVTFPGRTASQRLAAVQRRPAVPHGARVLPVAVVVVAGALAGLLALGPAGAMVGAAGAVTCRNVRARGRRDRAAAATSAALAAALDRIVEELRTGAHPTTALQGAATDPEPASTVLLPAATAAALGDGVPAALAAEAARRPEVARDLRRVAGAWALAERHGVPLADLLAGVHADLRWRLAYAGRVGAALAGPRATAAVLTGLPVLGILLGELVGAGPLHVLRSGVLGQVLVVSGVGLAAAGATWARAVLRSAVPR